ncbi:MAG TPA: ABC transporter ATP-binding protein [Lachnospiraceae bacterium]|nr:ABC transporter ATP-binding protein [Lachnospiraceae bacterium]
MDRICLSGIKSGYRRKNVLTGVSFSAGAGQCIGIVGANGSGKTTLFQVLSGLKKPDEGTISFDGVMAEGYLRHGLFIRYTGYVPQEDNLILELTVYDNLLLWYESLKKIQIAEQEGLLHLLSLERMYDLKVKNLSMGMKKRVSIACALAGNPPILLLDEPDASLDLWSKAELRDYLLLYKQAGGTVILATHDETQLEICDKVYTLFQGKCTEIDSKLRGKELMHALQASVLY